MTPLLRQIKHPGPPASERVVALPCQAVPIRLTLRAGHSLAVEVPEAFAQAGFAFGYLRLDGAAFAPLNYVIPAPAPGDGHAAWYSTPHQIAFARARHAGVHLGLRDGKSFLHCHGVWEGTNALVGMGHLLCGDSTLAQDCTVTGWGLAGAGLVARHDAETNFTLFGPEKVAGNGKANAILMTLRPNQDIRSALLAFAHGRGIGMARIEGIGSLVGTAFDDGQTIESYATEILVLQGQLEDGALSLRIASAGFDGRSHSGRVAPDANAVCVTAEILLLDETQSVSGG